MVKEAESNADTDKQNREAAEVRNEADSLVYSTEKLLRENDDEIEADEKSKAEGAIAELKSAIEGGDTEKTRAAINALNEAMHPIAERIYSSQQAEQPEGASEEGPAGGDGDSGSGGGSGTGSDAEDVDYEVVDEDETKS
jgi:molecular chaperone DnaK